MRRNGYIVMLVAALAWITVAIVLGTGAFAGKAAVALPSGVSPRCLPATLSHSSRLAGTSLDVSPEPETDSASPHTQISFMGAPVADIASVAVEGSRSGHHAGHLYGYSQGDGASFVADKPFEPGERVLVRAAVDAPGAGHQVAFSFGVATPYPTSGIPTFPNPPASPSSYQSFVTAPGLHPPVLAVTAPDRDPGAGDVLMTVGPGPGQYGPLIYAPSGRLVWFDDLQKGVSAEDLNAQRYEGQDDLTWWQGKVLTLGFGQGTDIVMDRNYQTIATIHAGNGYQADVHDFQIVPGEVAYLTAYDPIRCNLASVGGKPNGALIDTVVQAVDMKTGLVRWEWHSLDHVGVRESHTPVPTTAAAPWDYFHLNSVDPEPGGDLLVSGRSTWAAYQLQRGSGRVLWRLGGINSSFRMGPGAETAWQHDARMQPDGSVTFFDNGSNPRVHYQSRGVRLTIDQRHTAKLARVYIHPGVPLVADSQGDVQTLADESVVLGWGANPSVTEFAKDGALLFDAHLPAGDSSYRVLRFPWRGTPASSPAASARLLATEDTTAVFASWNGANEIAGWLVLAGPAPDALTRQARMPDGGFESSTIIPGAYAYVQVQALGADGRVLGSSPTVRVMRPPAAPAAG